MIAYNQVTNTAPSLDQQVAHAAEQLQAHGFDRYYNAIVGAYVSQVYKALPYRAFARATDRAKAPLTSLEQAVTYSTLYAKSHFDRFYGVLTHIMGDIKRAQASSKTINIVDYGCGQGIASLALISYLESYVNCESFTLNFYLVEPSQVTLDVAELLVSKMSSRIAANISIHTHHQDLNDFLEHGSETLAAADYSMHLFSNLLDIAEVQQQIPSLCHYLHNIEGKQTVIAVGPQYSSNYEGLNQLKDSLSDVNIKQDVADFCVESEIYSVMRNHWKHEPAYGVMMGLCFHNKASVSQAPIAA